MSDDYRDKFHLAFALFTDKSLLWRLLNTRYYLSLSETHAHTHTHTNMYAGMHICIHTYNKN